MTMRRGLSLTIPITDRKALEEAFLQEDSDDDDIIDDGKLLNLNEEEGMEFKLLWV